jgi:hypothetical protein
VSGSLRKGLAARATVTKARIEARMMEAGRFSYTMSEWS